MSINRVNITGKLTRDPELRVTAGGTQVLSFGVAVNDRRRNPQTGEWEDYPNFVDCTMFGTRAEAISRFLAKGNKVAIEGKLRYSSWEKDGQRRSKPEVIVDEIEFMSQRQGRRRPRCGPRFHSRARTGGNPALGRPLRRGYPVLASDTLYIQCKAWYIQCISIEGDTAYVNLKHKYPNRGIYQARPRVRLQGAWIVSHYRIYHFCQKDVQGKEDSLRRSNRSLLFD